MKKTIIIIIIFFTFILLYYLNLEYNQPKEYYSPNHVVKETTQSKPLYIPADNKWVNRKLNSVGKKIFINYFDLFKSYSQGIISKQESTQNLILKGVSNNNGAHIRLGNAKMIFEKNKECDALRLVINAHRISIDVINQAKKLMSNEQ